MINRAADLLGTDETILTVGDLRKVILDLPDDSPFLIYSEALASSCAFTLTKGYADGISLNLFVED